MGICGIGGGSTAGWLGFGFGWIFMLIFWAVIIWAIIAIVRHLSGPDYPHKGRMYREEKDGDGARAILRERYAKGEITKEEYDAKIKDIYDEHRY